MKEELKELYKKAMKEKDSLRKNLFNYLLSQISYLEKESWKDISNEEIIKIIQKELKQRKESKSYFKDNEDNENLKVLEQDIDLLESFLPDMYSEEELNKFVEEALSSLSVDDIMKARWDIIKYVFTNFDRSRVDWNLLNSVINKFK